MANAQNLSFSHEQTIDSLIEVLSKFKNAEKAKLRSAPIDLWLGNTSWQMFEFQLFFYVSLLSALFHLYRSNLEDAEYTPSQVSGCKTLLQSLRETGTLLTRLQESLQQATAAVENSLLPFETDRGLAKLPDSVLSHIFEIICMDSREDYWSSPPQMYLSLVCRRFRDVVSNSPRLWRWIAVNSTSSVDTVNVFLKKSKAANLDVEVFDFSHYYRRAAADVSSALALTLPHSERWESLWLILKETEKEDLASRIKPFNALRLPQLRNLSIVYPQHSSGNDTGPHPSLHFYKTCELHQLRSFHITNAIPETFPSSQLTSIQVELRAMKVNLKSLLDFLSANRTLEDIDLDFASIKYAGPRIAGGEVRLDNVKRFKLALGSTRPGGLYPFRRALCMPNVSKIELSVIDDYLHFYEDNVDPEYESDYLHGAWADAHRSQEYITFMLCDNDYQHLEHFRYEYLGDDMNDYRLPFQKMPRLRILELRTHNLCPSLAELRALPPLREVRIDWDSYLSNKWRLWLGEFRRQLEKQDKLHGLEKLFISYCDKNRYVNSLFGERVVWESWY